MDQRLAALVKWLRQTPFGLQLAAESSLDISSLTGDASARRYFRWNCAGELLIAVDVPPNQLSCRPFESMAQRWSKAGLRVPKILAINHQLGFMLLEDFGDLHLADKLVSPDAPKLYQQALGLLQSIRQLPTEQLTKFDEEFIRRELAFFSDWLIEQGLGLEVPECWAGVVDKIVASAQQQPQVAMHRDFHCRNLMLPEPGELGVIDFQDTLHGPLCYDLASLLKDCYVDWPKVQVEVWALEYWQAWQKQEQQSVSSEQFLLWFDWIGLQRHLKVLGQFIRLAQVTNKPGYLQYLPRTYIYVREVTTKYPELANFDSWLQQHLAPKIESLTAGEFACEQ